MASSEVHQGLDNDFTFPEEGGKSTEQTIAESVYDDPELNEMMEKLNSDVSFEPDRDLNIEETDSPTADSDSVSTSGSLRDADDNNDDNNDDNTSSRSPSLKNGRRSKEANAPHNSSTNSSNGSTSKTSSSSNHQQHRRSIDSTASKDSTVSDGKNGSSAGSKKTFGSSIRKPLKALKKLTKFDKSDSEKRRSSLHQSEFTAVAVDRLPQLFVVKYLGFRPINGLSGLHLVRRPVDEMVSDVKKKIDAQKETELPLLYVVVSPKGLDLREHKKNKVKSVAPLGMMPIDFISYGVQDIKYWRVFCCIVVREMSSRTTRTATCHAFLCDSSHSGRKMALSIGAAFGVHAKKLKSAGKEHNFQVELRPPDELADALEDCDA